MSITIDPTVVAKALAYDPNTGVFTWRIKPAGNVKVGDQAGSINDHGYVIIRINKRIYAAHRLAWLLTHGQMPTFVDHINGIKHDNRIANLREVSCAQNSQNRGTPRHNSTGVKGVYRNTAAGKYGAVFVSEGHRHYLGHFETIEEAAAAVRTKRAAICGAFANHGGEQGGLD